MTQRTPVTGDAAACSPLRANRPAVRPLDLAWLTALTVALRLPAFLSARHLTFDDGVFASSVLAMRDGGVPFRDVFSSQGPLFLPLAWLGDLAGGRTSASPRVLAVLSGVAVVLAVHWAALQVTDRLGARAAGALAATSGCLMWVTGPLAADGPALAFATLALGFALRQRDRPGWLHAAALGAAVGGALSTKAMEAPILLPVGLVLLAPLLASARRRSLDGTALGQAALAAAMAVAVFAVVTVPLGAAEVWDQSVRYRTDASTGLAVAANAGKILSTLWDRDLVLLAFAAVSLVAADVARRAGRAARPEGSEVDDGWWSLAPSGPGGGWRPSGRLLVVGWAVLTAVWLAVAVTPLWRPHVSALVPPLALVVGLYRPPLRWVAVTAVACVPLLWIQLDGLLVPGGYEGEEAEIVEVLRALPAQAWVLSDEPGLAWKAGHRTTDDLVDPSMLRVQQGRYDGDSLAAAAADPRVCAVVVRSPRRFGAFPELAERLESEGFEVALDFGGVRRVYTRAGCTAGS